MALDGISKVIPSRYRPLDKGILAVLDTNPQDRRRERLGVGKEEDVMIAIPNT